MANMVCYRQSDMDVVLLGWSIFSIGNLFDYLRTGSNSRDDLGDTAGKSLRDIMLEISRNAQRRGLTPEMLQSILDEDDEILRPTIGAATV